MLLGMKRILMILTVLLSLVVMPAMAQDCCEIIHSGHAEQKQEPDSQNDKHANVAHCCVCHHVADRHAPAPSVPAATAAASPVLMHTQHFGASITTGPLLEPPSHA